VQADPEAAARAIVLRRLTLSPRTRSELAASLDERLIPIDIREKVLDRFTEVGLIDDASLATSFTDNRRERQGWSRRAIERKLRERGIDRDLVATVLQEVSGKDELATATALVRGRWKRVGALDPVTRQRRLVSMLARRGYSYSVSADAIKVVDDEFTIDLDSK